MKIAVIGANGKSGTLVVREAVERGHEVTAIMRSEHPTQAQHTLIKDVFSLTRNDLLGSMWWWMHLARRLLKICISIRII